MDLTSIIEDAIAEDHTHVGLEPPMMVVGRVLQLDADISAYACCNLDETYAENVEILKEYIQIRRIMAGAEFINLHLTIGDKGGRYDIAILKEYQGNRKDRDPEQQIRVRALRSAMAEMHDQPFVTPVIWSDREADDGINIYQRKKMEQSGYNKSVISTTDKDLNMNPGLHMHPDTYEWKEVPDGYGSIRIDESTSSKKIVGEGTSFFWAQLLMGDSADNISGIPKISAYHNNLFNPTGAMLKAKTPDARAKLASKRKSTTCGPVLTFTLLKDCQTDKQAYDRVLELYQGYFGSGEITVTKWDGSSIKTTAREIMLSEARLLWMHRTPEDDVLDFFNEVNA